jgi:hypothetical protein
MATIVNENNMVIWFGMLRMDESMSEMQEHLRQLQKRLQRQQKTTKIVIYVDNCCIVREKILEVWPDAIVKLDIFHWLKRWNQILKQPHSLEAGVFRALMSKAVLVASKTEYDRVRTKLQEKVIGKNQKGTITVSEVWRKCKTVAPPKEEIEALVLSVLSYSIKKDAETKLKLAIWSDEDEEEDNNRLTKPVLLFKTGKEIQQVIRNQLAHIRKDCMSDPEGFDLYREVKGEWKCARGSSSNERNNRSLEEKAFASSVGLKSAKRKVWIELDRHNTSSNIWRCGAANTFTSNHEGCAVLNSIAME